MIAAVLLGFIGRGCKDHWIVFIRSLQIILNLPMINISLPQTIIDFYSYLFQVAAYDILGKYDIWK